MFEILMAEDDPHLRKILAETFREEGYFVRAVGNGLKLVQEFDRKTPDLVLLDLDMPVMNGVGACREIHKRDPLMIKAYEYGYIVGELNRIRELNRTASEKESGAIPF